MRYRTFNMGFKEWLFWRVKVPCKHFLWRIQTFRGRPTIQGVIFDRGINIKKGLDTELIIRNCIIVDTGEEMIDIEV